MGPLSIFTAVLGVLCLILSTSYIIDGCDLTLAKMGYNFHLTPELPHPECGPGAALFLGHIESFFIAEGLALIALGIAPKFGVPVSKKIYAIAYLCFFPPMRLGFITAFATTE